MSTPSINRYVNILFAIVASLLFVAGPVSAQDRVFTTQELLEYDGRAGNPTYVGYEGVVYDVSDSDLWEDGEHFGLRAGQDLTEEMASPETPHGDEVLVGFAKVGVIEGSQSVAASDSSATSQEAQPWYMGRLTVLNISILGWTGILLGIFFFFTFATCFAVPWSKFSVPWSGSRPGKDSLDQAPTHLKLTSIHKHFVWWTIILGLIHGVLGFLQLLGVYL